MLQGALVANYPWDANDPGETGYAGSPDDATFRCSCERFCSCFTSVCHDPVIDIPCCWFERCFRKFSTAAASIAQNRA